MSDENGNRCIQIKIYFFSNIPGGLQKKHCWDAGFVSLVKNPLHDIKSQPYGRKNQNKPVQVKFGSIAQISSAVEKAIKQAGITVHHGEITKKIFTKGDNHAS